MADVTIGGGLGNVGGAPAIDAATKPEEALIFSSSSDRTIPVTTTNGQQVYISSDQWDTIKKAITANPQAYPSLSDAARRAIVGQDDQGNPLTLIR